MENNTVIISGNCTIEQTQLDELLTDTETKLSAAATDMQAKRVQMDEAYQMYVLAKEYHDAAEGKFNYYSETKKSLVRLREGLPPEEDVRAMRATSVTEKEPKQVRKREMRWMDYAIQVLERDKTFMHPETLYKKIVNFDEFTQGAVQRLNRPEKQLMQLVLKNFERSCNLSRIKNEGTLIDWHGTIGLLAWTTDDLVPEAPYLNGLMQNSRPPAKKRGRPSRK